MSNLLVSVFVSSMVSFLIMKFQIEMIKRWLDDFFDKQDEWLKEHFEDLAKILFR